MTERGRNGGSSGGEAARDRLLTADEVAGQLGISKKTVYGFAEQGLIGYFRLGRRLIRFSPSHVNEFLDRGLAEVS